MEDEDAGFRRLLRGTKTTHNADVWRLAAAMDSDSPQSTPSLRRLKITRKGHPSHPISPKNMHQPTLRPATTDDADALAAIYNHYIMQTIVTFEEEAIAAAEMAERIVEITEKFPWIVCEVDGKVVGYAYASSWKSRCAYRNSVETTVYLHPDATGQGHGRALYDRLLSQLQALGLHAAIGGIALPNPGSVALHEKCGFVKVGEFVEVGHKFGKWINVGYWQRVF